MTSCARGARPKETLVRQTRSRALPRVPGHRRPRVRPAALPTPAAEGCSPGYQTAVPARHPHPVSSYKGPPTLPEGLGGPSLSMAAGGGPGHVGFPGLPLRGRSGKRPLLSVRAQGDPGSTEPPGKGAHEPGSGAGAPVLRAVDGFSEKAVPSPSWRTGPPLLRKRRVIKHVSLGTPRRRAW